MSVYTKYYFGTPGSTGFYDPELANVIILKVTRTCLTFMPVTSGEPTAGQVLYLQPSGGIFFDPGNPFSGDPLAAAWFDLEKISVKFKAA